MKQLLYTVLLGCILAPGLHAQSGVKGTVQDSSGTALPSATVMLMQAKDSVLQRFGLTDPEGNFELKRLPSGSYLLRITYVGYQMYSEEVKLSGGSDVMELPIIQLAEQSTDLDAVTVVGERNPVEIKDDTIAYNANSFQVQPNAAVEDLLKRLPGMEVDRDGNVKAQGEDVQRVLVDGKEFFGDDPKIATKNLPADAVDKVEVFDQKSDQAEFTGIDDGQREKTINLKLKKDKKKGQFGTITAAYGDQGRYQGKATISRFSPKTKLSFIGNLNNINEQGFGINDYINFMGGMRNLRGGGGRFGGGGVPLDFGQNTGVATTGAAGLNLNHEFSDKVELNASYFLNHLDKLTLTNSQQETFLRDESFFTNTEERQQDLNTNHRLNLRLDADLDSLQSLRLRSNFTYSNTELSSFSESASRTDEGNLQNASEQDNTNEGQRLNGTANLLYRRKFKTAGRTFSLNLNYGVGDTQSDGLNTSENLFYDPADPMAAPRIQRLNQEFLQDNGNDSYGLRAVFTEPIGRGKFLEASYSYNENQNDVSREVFDIDGENRVFNQQLSNIYNSIYNFNRGGLKLLMNKLDWTLTMGLNCSIHNSMGIWSSATLP